MRRQAKALFAFTNGGDASVADGRTPLRRGTPRALIAALLVSALALALGLSPAQGAPGDAPEVTTPTIDEITLTEAVLRSDINPNGLETTFFFEYRASGGLDWLLTEEDGAGDGTDPGEVSRSIEDLEPETEYEARVVATNETGTTTSAIATFETLPEVPPSVTDPIVSEVDLSTALFSGEVLAVGIESNEYRFEYRASGDPDWIPLPDGNEFFGSGFEPTPVEQHAKGLTPGTEYEVRLFATNEFGDSISGIVVFETLPPEAPAVARPIVTELSADSARLTAGVDPREEEATFRFEYRRAGDPDWIATPDPDEPFGNEPAVVATEVSGLDPETEYVVRAVAANGTGETTSEQLTFTTRTDTPGPLPERAYEMVTPPDKGGFDVSSPLAPGLLGAQASPTGDAVTSVSAFTFPGTGAQSSPVFVSNLSTRPASGQDQWQTSAVTAPLTNPDTGAGTSVVGFSEDLSHAVMQMEGTMPGDPPQPPTRQPLYLRDNFNLDYELLTPGLFPNGRLIEERQEFQASDDYEHFVWNTEYPEIASDPLSGGRRVYESFVNGSGERELRIASVLPDGSLVSAELGTSVSEQNAVSDDGERIFFRLGEGAIQNNDVYVREHGTTTTFVGNGRFIGATPSGSRVFIKNGGDLARYDLDAQTTKLLGNGLDDIFASGILGYSDDGSRVYFTTTAALAPGAPGAGTKLYLWQDGPGGGTHTFIASMVPGGDSLNWSPSFSSRSSQVSADGEQLLFQSSAQITGFDTQGTEQVYLFDADGTLECVSCPLGPATGNTRRGNLTATGELVFFESDQSLVNQDSNGLTDVYQYEVDTGRVSLLSSGRSGSHSIFGDASLDGRDVFIGTRERLVGWDFDTEYDLYDVRLGGGLPEPPPGSPPCEGDACLSPPAIPNDPTPGSATLNGPGNARLAASCGRFRDRASQVLRRAQGAAPEQAKGLRKQAAKLKRQAKRCRASRSARAASLNPGGSK